MKKNYLVQSIGWLIALLTFSFSPLLHAGGLFSKTMNYPSQGNVLEKDEILEIRLGMSKEQVKNILGHSVLSVPMLTDTLYYVECFDCPTWAFDGYYFTLRQAQIFFDDSQHVIDLVWRDYCYDEEVFKFSLNDQKKSALERENLQEETLPVALPNAALYSELEEGSRNDEITIPFENEVAINP